MICRNLQLRPLAWTTTLLYFMSVEAPQQALGTHREVPHSSQCYSTWAPELVWVKQAKEEVTEQGPPPPHCSLNHTHSFPTVPQHRAPWELLPSPTCEPLLASPVLCLWAIWRSGYALPTQGQSYCNRPKASEESQQCVSREWHKNEHGG